MRCNNCKSEINHENENYIVGTARYPIQVYSKGFFRLGKETEFRFFSSSSSGYESNSQSYFFCSEVCYSVGMNRTRIIGLFIDFITFIICFGFIGIAGFGIYKAFIRMDFILGILSFCGLAAVSYPMKERYEKLLGYREEKSLHRNLNNKDLDT